MTNFGHFLSSDVGDWRASLLAALLVANSATFLTMSDAAIGHFQKCLTNFMTLCGHWVPFMKPLHDTMLK
jgi:hypothetical protein